MYSQKIYYENLNKINCDFVGKYDIPLINSCDVDDNLEFIGFNYAKSCKNPENKSIHFFLDDYQFTRLWNAPEKYLDLLSKFKYVCTPDFSLYTNFPKAMQIYNHYRKHWLGAFWQEYGIKVIPTICWGNEDSYSWCFDGEPQNSTVCISSVGTQNDKISKELFLKGYNEMMERLKPEKILFFGKVPEECEGNIVKIDAFQEKFRLERKRNKWVEEVDIAD